MECGEYVYLSSSTSQEYFAANTAANFTNILPKKLELQGSWEVALLQIHYPPSSKGQFVKIQTDIASDVIYEDNMLPVLRRIPITTKGKLYTPSYPFYIPVKKDHVDRISISIINDQGQFPSFTKKPVRCTLHFRKCLQ